MLPGLWHCDYEAEVQGGGGRTVKRYLCNACLQPCDLNERDDGVGMTQVGSQWQDDSRPYLASDCCDAGFVVPDPVAGMENVA